MIIETLENILGLSSAEALVAAVEVANRSVRSMSRVSQWANWAEPGSQEWHRMIGEILDHLKFAKDCDIFTKCNYTETLTVKAKIPVEH